MYSELSVLCLITILLIWQMVLRTNFTFTGDHHTTWFCENMAVTNAVNIIKYYKNKSCHLEIVFTPICGNIGAVLSLGLSLLIIMFTIISTLVAS